MNWEISTTHALLIVLIMAVVTLATRWGGVFIMSFVPISDGVRRFIGAMSGSVLIAILAPVAVEGDLGARLALLTTLVLILIVKRPLIAISSGFLMAALVRYFMG
ncbi:Predicted membrane protein [Oligella ureolytica]|uniref:AzlD domain-containing protein n=1 Tax=Oligella ureolytica TaxID=90244 RepID=A0A378XD86_9BURK|nr:AzlD domain-containing protein [Oligella ureolytica]QPT40709.1 AzlD domain-containing protein [Oligella ureolytica]SUA52511.1 Predicted membrane protein [Oligella ureolytica]SUA58352.1 Predicted membrane protein [Oligella ureolytica]